MGKVLYREYRPRSLEDVKGQDHIVNALKNILKNNAIAHAYLFTGTHGVGKTSVARILAHLINDIEYTGENDHLDIIEIDAASNRRIDEIRELREKAFVAPTSAKYKVYIIDEVHMLTREAFNALLKTLEEPPEHAIFILATTEAHKVPQTIISRTQRFSFKPQENESLINQLLHVADKESIPLTKEALNLLARHSNRSFRDALSLLDQVRYIPTSNEGSIDEQDVALVLGMPSNELVNALVDALMNDDVGLLFATTEKLRKQGIAAPIVAQELLYTLRESINAKKYNDARIVQTMKHLLERITNATYDTIEIAMLHNMPRTQESTTVITASKETNNPRQEPREEKQHEPKIEKIHSEEYTEKKKEIHATELRPPKETEKLTGDIEWDTVLNNIKGDHNTLYGVLKMSNISFDGSLLMLTFDFAFHEKQFLQTRNVSILKKTIKELYGQDIDIKTSVKSSTQSPPVTHTEKKIEENNDLTGISDIFSGAELLE